MSNTTEILVSASMFGKLYSKMIMEVSDKYSMNKVEVDILLFLNNNPKYDTAKDIVELRGIAKSYVSKSVDKLVAKNFLSIHADKEDRRVIHLKVENLAGEVIKEALEAQRKYVDTIYNGISKEEEEVLKEIVNKMLSNIKKEL